MTALALALVLTSALFHSTWNLLLKRARKQEAFTVWLLASVAVTMLPVAAYFAWRYPMQPQGWAFLAGSVALNTLYFFFLSRGYASGDLSLVYPIARGMGPMLVPVLGVLALGERVSAQAMVGIGCVVAGIYTVNWGGRLRDLRAGPMGLLRRRETRYALLTGLCIAGYSVVDKQGVKYVHPVLYNYLLCTGAAIGVGLIVLRTAGTGPLGEEWRAGAWRPLAAGFLMFLSYSLVLTAFQIARVSYVTPAREVGIAFAVLLGAVALREPFAGGRLLGAGLIIAGVVLIALAP